MDEIQVPDVQNDFGQTGRQLIRLCRKGRWWILLTGFATLCATVLVLAFVPNLYKSEATIQIVEQQVSQSLVAPLSTATEGQKLEAMTNEVLSRARLLEIMEENDLFVKERSSSPDEAVDLMRKSIGVQPTGVTRQDSFDAFSISFSAHSPEKAQQVTRKLSELFIQRNSEAQATRATTTANFLKGQLNEKRRRAAELEQGIQAFKTQYVGELPDERQVNQMRLDEVRTQLQNTVASLNRAKGQRVVWESMLNGNLNAALTRLKSERAALLTRFTPKHPDVVKKDEEIAQLETLLGQVANGGDAEKSSRLPLNDPVVAQLGGQLEANRMEVEDLAKDEKRLQASVGELQGHLNLTPAREQQIAGMTRELSALNEDITAMEKIEQPSELAADMEKRQEGQQFRELDPPTLPSKPSSPARFKISLVALVVGVLIGLALAFLMDLRSPTFHSEKELRQRFSPPMVITVPLLPTTREKRVHFWKVGFEWVGGCALAAAMLAVEFYVFTNT